MSARDGASTGTGPVSTRTSAIPKVERLRESVRTWFTSSVSRGRGDVLTVGRASIAAALAYLVSGFVWNHEHPFFSSIVAFIIIGFGIEKKMRKIVEMSCGVMLGVLLGELARGLIGSGTWQILVVVFVAGMLSRFIDSSNLFGFQVAIQSLLVMIMPLTPSMTPGGRVLDAITGVLVAIVIHLLLSGDPRRLQSRAAASFYRELEDTLVSLALSARSGDRGIAQAALRNIREVSQKYTDEWTLANDVAHEDVDFTEARRKLRLYCSYLSPEMLLRNDEGKRPGRAGHFEGVTLTIQLRSLAIDLLQATGLSAAEAKRFLPSLVVVADGDAIGPRPGRRAREGRSRIRPAGTRILAR